MNANERNLSAANAKLAGSMNRMPQTTGVYPVVNANPELVRAFDASPAKPSTPLIALAVIHGNEEGVIQRFIHSFAPAVDSFVFVRAVGALHPDATREAIPDAFIPNLTRCATVDRKEYTNAPPAADWPHVDNFGAARQLAWEQAAATGAKYLLWADCDDTLSPGAAEALIAAAESGSHDVFLCPYSVRPGGEQVVIRERLVRNDGCSHWRYPVHEQLAFSREVTYRHLPGAVFNHQPPAERGGRSDRNLRILQAAVVDNARNLFYIAMDKANNPARVEEFRQFASTALAMPDLEPENRYTLLLMLAEAENGPKSKEWAAMALAVMPDRREAMGLLAGYALIEARPAHALAFGRMMMGTPKPTRSYWTLNHPWYDWKGVDLWVRCLRANDRGADADKFALEKAGAGGFTFSIIHATLWRCHKAVTIRQIWLERARNPLAVEYIFGLHECDAESQRFIGKAGFLHTVCPSPDGKPQSAIANGDCATAAATGRILIGAQDDVIPPDGWDDLLLARIKAQAKSDLINPLLFPLFIATSDGIRKDGLCVNPMMSRIYQKHKRADCDGTGMGHSGYHSMFWDNEITHRARKDADAGRCIWVDATDVVFYHHHPINNPAIPIDATYAEQNAPEHYATGRKLFLARNPDAKP